jgi:hypothetical protein
MAADSLAAGAVLTASEANSGDAVQARLAIATIIANIFFINPSVFVMC